MAGARPWQIAIVILGFLALGAMVFWQVKSGNDQVELADEILLVDVTSGELIAAPLPKKRAVMFPANNPATNTASLMPAVEKDGKWFVKSRYVPFVKDVAGSDKGAVDLKTGEVLKASGEPARKDVF